MSNIITPSAVAKLALVALENNLCMGGLVTRQYTDEFQKKGDTITIRKPTTFDVVEFDGDLTGEWQEAEETSDTVSLDHHFTVPIRVTTKDMSLEVTDFYSQFVEPAVQAMAQKVDHTLTGLYKDIPYYEDCESTTAMSDIINARKTMVENKCPINDGKLAAVMSPTTTASLLGIDTFIEADKRGHNAALERASLGRVLGYDFFESQNVRTHAIGSTDTAGAVDLTAGYSAGATTIHVDALGTGTINKGTILTIADTDGTYVVTDDATISSNECDLNIYPGLEEAVDNDKAVTIHEAATTSSENLMFHRNAFTLVSAPLDKPIGGATGDVIKGRDLTLNATYGYDMNTQSNLITISLLCGVKTLYPELACRLYDAG